MYSVWSIIIIVLAKKKKENNKLKKGTTEYTNLGQRAFNNSTN